MGYIRASLMDDVWNHSFVICSDIREALMAVDSYLITSKKVLKCRELLEVLLLVPGHSNILGNSKADSLTNRDTKGFNCKL